MGHYRTGRTAVLCGRACPRGIHTYERRLTEILDNKGDDYGAARLIVDYLMTKETSDELAEISSNIESGEVYAKETADLRKEDFIGNLELAQSYGQIDNSVEDKKEKILQIVDEWYEWALESSNYGFFKRVMDGYLDEIREEAKSREADLLEQLGSFKETTIPGLSAEAKEKRVARIQAMIKEQNYTVAEDLLARSSAFEEEQEELIEEDFLKEFLDHYDDYYQPVATRNVSFATLVSSRTRNKEQRGAKRLADNWLPGGSKLGAEKLRNLLNCLGFKVANILAQNAIGKFEHFSVQTEKAKGGQRDNYTHPIAAFGSGAALDGFRVVCINGAYDADSLIEIMKEIGNAKHTMILYDNALSMSERRRLARKTKNALGDKLFAVVDRTVMMFLDRNYDETKMNKIYRNLQIHIVVDSWKWIDGYTIAWRKKMLIDFHYHLDLVDNMKKLIQDLNGSDVGVFAVGTTPKVFIKEQDFCIENDNIRVGLGLHPQLVSERAGEIDLYMSLLNNSRFIGEIGLDFNSAHLSSREMQISCFKKIAVACASQSGKILSIHSVRAAGTVLDVLEESGTLKSCLCILHWFTGTAAERKRAIDDGVYFSINPRMLKTKSGVDTIMSIPIDKIILETDAPFTKKLNDINSLKEELHSVINRISDLRGIEVSEQIQMNSSRIWN